MAARLGLDARVWQLYKGVNNLGLKSVYFCNIISNKSFYTLPPDEYNKTYSDEELKCTVPKENGNGMNKYFSKVQLTYLKKQGWRWTLCMMTIWTSP
jgi:hypothetical protein